MLVYEDSDGFWLAACFNFHSMHQWCWYMDQFETVATELSLKAVDCVFSDASAVSVDSLGKRQCKLFSIVVKPAATAQPASVAEESGCHIEQTFRHVRHHN